MSGDGRRKGTRLRVKRKENRVTGFARPREEMEEEQEADPVISSLLLSAGLAETP
ncbi:hypothetical protein K0M31_001341 [Melipona bicolor]|uniref:Uncharacterized protein n=1 Tax=Melipona bicolor TaxID=60889 RepID=A0AA40KXM3_9HYME|nr:hypothetical protein K0M31_001341 [Melipona bicolor]